MNFDRPDNEIFISLSIQIIQDLKHNGIKSITYTYNKNATSHMPFPLTSQEFSK